MEDVVKFIVDNRLGDVASVVGILVTLVGFIITIINVVRSKKAATLAEEAVAKIRRDILRVDTVGEFSAALTTMEEIKRLHRKGAWEILPDRYSALRKSLITIRTSNAHLDEAHKRALLGAIQHFKGMEQKVDAALAASQAPENVEKLNQIVSTQIDKLQEVLAEIKNQIGR